MKNLFVLKAVLEDLEAWEKELIIQRDEINKKLEEWSIQEAMLRARTKIITRGEKTLSKDDTVKDDSLKEEIMRTFQKEHKLPMESKLQEACDSMDRLVVKFKHVHALLDEVQRKIYKLEEEIGWLGETENTPAIS